MSGGGFGDGAGAHSASGSSGSFSRDDRRENYPYYYSSTAFPYGTGYGTGQYYTQQEERRSQSTASKCCIGPAAVLILGTLAVLFGVYSPLKIEAGLNCSRLLKANRLFVREIEVKNYDGSGEPIVYTFHERPQLTHHRRWSHEYSETLDAERHQEWALWLNKGSIVTIDYNIRTPSSSGIIFAVLKDSDHFSRWLDDPLSPQSAIYWRRVKGAGRLQFPVDEDDDYYFAFGNTHYSPARMDIRIQAELTLYSTENSDSECSLRSHSCKVKLPLFRSTSILLTTPYKTTQEMDVWRMTVAYKTRWATFIVIYGALIGALLLITKPWKKPGDSRSDEGGKTSEVAPLINKPEEVNTEAGENIPPASEERLCVVCLEAEKDSFFVPCGHCATCFSCGTRIKESGNATCPICRQDIGTVRRIFR